MQEVLVAMETFAHALKDAHADFCGDTPGLCKKLKEKLDKNKMAEYMASASFVSQDGVAVSRHAGSRATRSYDVMNIQLDGTGYTAVKVRAGNQSGGRVPGIQSRIHTC